jgi:hypothetical protein
MCPAGFEPAPLDWQSVTLAHRPARKADELRTRGSSALPLSYGPIPILEKCRSDRRDSNPRPPRPITLRLRPALRRARDRGAARCSTGLSYGAPALLLRAGGSAPPAGAGSRLSTRRGASRPAGPSCHPAPEKETAPPGDGSRGRGGVHPLEECGGATRAPRRPSRVPSPARRLRDPADTTPPRRATGPPGGCCCRVRGSACEGASWVTETKKEPCPDATVPRPPVDELRTARHRDATPGAQSVNGRRPAVKGSLRQSGRVASRSAFPSPRPDVRSRPPAASRRRR